ncbi:hypothetical protein M9Y10_010826 [Tritrichomonas musculus]|uniref:Uncharacterized protein n=1 Tax=Tritrichomonas musculus TaxID=1915356 RepID=A0ABR2IMP9_9EUKA
MSESVLVSKQLEQKLIRVLEQKEENEIEYERTLEGFKISCGYALRYWENNPIPYCPDSNKDDEKIKSRLIQCRFDDEIYDLEILKLKDKIAEAKINEIQDINEL